ncbi:MAG: hypothetical protein D6746_04585 [Bacteroidetes bacterium]|nr:MAG: hypothetical protein D6746_04585 [Bacteroidota bacterium]
MDPVLEFLSENSSSIRTPKSRSTYREQLCATERALGKCLLEASGEELVSHLQACGLAPSTVKLRRSVLRSFYRWAVRSGRLDRDPTLALDDMKVQARPVRRHNWLSPEEVGRLLDHWDDTPAGVRNRAGVALLALCGLRASEAVGLTWGDVDLDRRQLHVLGKGGKHAEVGIPSEAAKRLRLWRERLDAVGWETQWVLPALAHTHVGWVLRGGPLSYKGLLAAVAGGASDLFGRRVRLHDLRRSLAGMLEDRGVPVTDIQRVLRHSSVATTQRYLADNPSKGVQVLQDFEL